MSETHAHAKDFFDTSFFNKPMLSGRVKHSVDNFLSSSLKDMPIAGTFGMSNHYTCVGNVNLHIDLLSFPVQKNKTSWVGTYM